MRPLEGVRVLDFTRVLSGPHATRMLCDLGADVIKVEQPTGDLTRFSSPRVNSNATYFIQQNVGKRNISLDLTKPEAVEIVKLLIEKCDVLIENFRPGVMARLGLGEKTLRKKNPRLVYASITGYGNTGPWVNRRAFAPVINAEMGLTKRQGDARGGNTPTTRLAMPTSIRQLSVRARSWRRCFNANATVRVNTSTCRWHKLCSTSTNTHTTIYGKSQFRLMRFVRFVPKTTQC